MADDLPCGRRRPGVSRGAGRQSGDIAHFLVSVRDDVKELKEIGNSLPLALRREHELG